MQLHQALKYSVGFLLIRSLFACPVFFFYSVPLHRRRKQVRLLFAASQGEGHRGSRQRGFSPGHAASVRVERPGKDWAVGVSANACRRFRAAP